MKDTKGITLIALIITIIVSKLDSPLLFISIINDYFLKASLLYFLIFVKEFALFLTWI